MIFPPIPWWLLPYFVVEPFSIWAVRLLFLAWAALYPDPGAACDQWHFHVHDYSAVYTHTHEDPATWEHHWHWHACEAVE